MEEKQSESDLLERVFLRLGHANSDEKLEKFAKRFLTPVILKLSSQDEDVKKKVLELLAHINRSLEYSERVQLPIGSLFVQCQDPLCTPYVRNSTILYVKMGFSRLSPEKQLHYLPQLFLCMKDKPKPQQDCLLQVAIRPVLALILLSSDESSTIMKLYSIIDKDISISESFLSFVLDILLVPYSAFSSKVIDFQRLHGADSEKKLKMFGVQFTHHLCKCSSDEVMAVVAPVLLSTLLKLAAKNDKSNLKKITYQAIGKISRKAPSLFQDSNVIQSLFDAFHHEDLETGFAVMQSLTMVATACKGAPSPTLALIEDLILSNIGRDHRHCRLAALQVANILFPTTHVKSRYACLLASADKIVNIREEANKGLLIKAGNGLPDFTEMVNQIVCGTNGYSQAYVTIAGSLVYSPGVFIKILSHLKQCLKSSAGVTRDDEVNDKFKRYIQHIFKTQPSAIMQYLSLIREASKPVGTSELHSLALICLLEFLVSAPTNFVLEFSPYAMHWLKSFVWSPHDAIRHTSSHVVGILKGLLGNNVGSEENQLFDAIESLSKVVQYGTAVSCGFLIGQYLAHTNGNSLDGPLVKELATILKEPPKIVAWIFARMFINP